MKYQSSSPHRSQATSRWSVAPLFYALIGALFVIGVSTNALQIQSSLRSAFQTIGGIFVTSGGVMPVTGGANRNVIFSINEGGNGTIRFGNLTGNTGGSTVLVLDPNGVVLQKPLSELSGVLREILSGSLGGSGGPINSTNLSSGDIWNMISGAVRNEVLQTISNNTGAIISILSGGLKQLTREYVFGSGGNGLDGQMPEICRQITRLCTNGRIATGVAGLSGIDGLMGGSGLTGPTGGLLYFNINRPTSRPGIPVVNVGSETENRSEYTTVSDFIEGYFFPNSYLQTSMVGGTAMPFGPNGNTTITRTVTGSVIRNASTISEIIITPGPGVSVLSVNGVARPVGTETNSFTVTPTNPAPALPQNIVMQVRFATNNANYYTVSITAKDTKNKTSSANTTFSWFRWAYAGIIDTVSPSGSQIIALNKLSLRSDLTTARATQNYQGSVGYRYVALPQDQTNPDTKFQMWKGDNKVDMNYIGNAPMSITSPEGYTANYNVWRSTVTQQDPASVFTYQFEFK